MKLKIMTPGGFRNSIAYGAKVEHVELPVDYRAYLGVLYAVLLVAFALSLPFFINGIIK